MLKLVAATFMSGFVLMGSTAHADEQSDWDNISMSTAREYIEKYRDALILPDGYAPKFNTCFSDECVVSQAEAIHQFPLAYKGDYQSQRNTAFCLFTGCDGAMATQKNLACAWRIVILVSDDPQVDDTDQANWTLCKRTLDESSITSALRLSEKLYRQIYGKKIPKFKP